MNTLCDNTMYTFKPNSLQKNMFDSIILIKIHGDRVNCFVKIKDTLQSAVKITRECVEALLRVKTSEQRVNHLLHRFHDMKEACEKAEVFT